MQYPEITKKIVSINNSHLRYRIAGNFRGVQIFAVFADRQGTAKIKTMKFLTHRVSRDVVYVRTVRGVWYGGHTPRK